MSPCSCFGIWLFVLHNLPLNTGAVSSPVISLAGIDRDKGGVVLQCESAGWYPEPEVLWLDGERKLLSAGPTETVRGPDDLYTVSSRVTVEKRHSNSFTCRVQQRNINQARETHIQVPADFFMVPSCPAVPVTIGLSVLLLSIAAVVFVVFKWRQHKKESEKESTDEIEGGEKMKNQSNKPLSETLTEIETLLDTLEKEDRKEAPKKFVWWRAKQQLREEQQRREAAEREVETLREQLDAKRNKNLKEKKHKLKNNLQDLHQEIKETKNLKEKKHKLKNNLQDLHQEIKETKVEGTRNFFDKFRKPN